MMHTPDRPRAFGHGRVGRVVSKAATSACRSTIERLEGRVLLSAVDVLTQHNDYGRTGQNLGETVLNTGNVNLSTFGRLYSRPVDDQIYAQPLYATNVAIPGQGTHNIVYVATVNDSVYAFDADDPTVTAPYWKDSFINPAAGVRPVASTDVGQNCGTYKDFSGNIGIVSTPVIDRSTNTMYLLARTVENGTFVQRLHAIDLITGAEKYGGPVSIQASVPGTGAGSTNGTLVFSPQTENQRAALALDQGNVIITWASHCDTGPYHGWVMAYNETSLQQQWVWNSTPNGSDGGIWQSGQGPAIDAQGNLYFTTGNGTDDSADYSEAFIKLSPAGQLLDYFIPNNYASLNNVDADLGSAGPLLIPGTSLMVTGGKEGKFYLVDQNNLGKLNTTADQVVQEFQVTPKANNDHIHGSPVYYQDSNGNQWIYVWGMSDVLKQFSFNGAQFSSTTPTYTSNVTVAPTPSQPGAMLSISANGAAAGSGIIWTVSTLGPSANNAVQPGIFRAFDASNVSHELWNSQQNAARDDFGNLAKFNEATVDNGRVYLPTFSNQLVVYGLLQGVPVPPATLTATPVSGKNEVDLSWSSVSGAVQYVLERKVGGGTYTPLAIVNNSTTTYQDTNVIAGAVYSYRVRAENSVGDSSPVTATAQVNFVQQQLARWRFDEGTGTTTADTSGNNNNGTLGAGATWTTAGKIGDALNFDGTRNGYVQVPDSPTLDPQGIQISIAAWIKAVDWNGNRRIVQKGNGGDNQYRLTAESNLLKFDLFGVGTASGTLPSTGVWHQVTGTYDGAVLKLYVDGAQIGSTTLATPGAALAVTSGPLFIGTKSLATSNSIGDFFSGTIDDVRIYNYALSAGDVQTLATGAAPGAPTGLTVTPSSASTISVSWTAADANASGFILERRTATGSYSQIAQLASGTSSFIDTGLAASTTYFYRIKAFNVIDNSAYSPEMSGTTQGIAINSLVAEWKFDEAAGSTAADATGFGNTGTLFGSPTFVTDTADGSPHALSFNGTSQWVRVNDSSYLEPTSAITLAAWVNAGDWSQTRGIISKGAREGSYYLVANNNLLTFNLSGQGTLTAPLPGAGVWHHIVGTYDGMAMRLYVDGTLVASQAAGGTLATSTDPLFIGGTADSATTGLAFSGLLDDVRVYNFAITPQQVSAIYGNAAYWKLDENAGSTAADSSPNANTLSLIGNPAWISGKDAYALAFDGATQYGVANDNQVLNPTGAITLMGWINASDWNGSPRIIQKGNSDDQYELIAGSGNLQFNLAGVGSLSTPVPSAGSWHLVAGTYDGSTMKIYVDGALVNSASASGALAATSDPLYVAGAPGGVADEYFHGALDDLAIFSRALTPGEIQAIDSAQASAKVVGRFVFYNNSAFNGNTLAPAPGDLAAIAGDKFALLPGHGPAAFANYTSYSKGLNGIIVDITSLPHALTAADFNFLAGNTADPTTWSAAPAPAAIAVFPVSGGNISHVEITWTDGAIRNQWLQVTVRADANTGLAIPDVFYFGNLVGETGKPPVSGQFVVTSADMTSARNDLHNFLNPAPLTDPNDFNRDGRVDAIDQLIARQSAGLGNVLVQLSAPTAATAAVATPAPTATRTMTRTNRVATLSSQLLAPTDPPPPPDLHKRASTAAKRGGHPKRF